MYMYAYKQITSKQHKQKKQNKTQTMSTSLFEKFIVAHRDVTRLLNLYILRTSPKTIVQLSITCKTTHTLYNEKPTTNARLTTYEVARDMVLMDAWNLPYDMRMRMVDVEYGCVRKTCAVFSTWVDSDCDFKNSFYEMLSSGQHSLKQVFGAGDDWNGHAEPDNEYNLPASALCKGQHCLATGIIDGALVCEDCTGFHIDKITTLDCGVCGKNPAPYLSVTRAPFRYCRECFAVQLCEVLRYVRTHSVSLQQGYGKLHNTFTQKWVHHFAPNPDDQKLWKTLLKKVEDEESDDRNELIMYMELATGACPSLLRDTDGSVVCLYASEGEPSAYWYYLEIVTDDADALVNFKSGDDDDDDDDEDEDEDEDEGSDDDELSDAESENEG